MEHNSNNNILEYIHISKATDDILKYINDRRKGINKSLKTKWRKLNNSINGGLEAHQLITIAGISGSGKSSFANSLETDLFDVNPNEEFVVLDFSFEMLASRNIGRKISAKLDRTTNELYSGYDDIHLTDEDFSKVNEASKSIKDYPIYFVETSGTVEEIQNTIEKFLQEDFVQGKLVVVFLDHTLLTKGKQTDSERKILSDLQYMFVHMKRKYKICIVQLSQLNRNIEEKERILNPTLHFPTRSDLFASDSLYQASDIVMVIHRPYTLGIPKYSLEKWDTEGLVYIHILKNRDGEPKILRFEDHLKYNKLKEYDPLNSLNLK
jgi:replicative DNA helicase